MTQFYPLEVTSVHHEQGDTILQILCIVFIPVKYQLYTPPLLVTMHLVVVWHSGPGVRAVDSTLFGGWLCRLLPIYLGQLRMTRQVV